MTISTPFTVEKRLPSRLACAQVDAILQRRGPITRAMAKRLQEDWNRDVGEGPRILRGLSVDFVPMG